MPFKLADAPIGFSITAELSTPKNLYEPTTGESAEVWIRFIGHLLRNTLSPVISYQIILDNNHDNATEYSEAIIHIYKGLHNLMRGLNSLQAHLTKRSTTFSPAGTEIAGTGRSKANPLSSEQGVLNFIQPFEAEVKALSVELYKTWTALQVTANGIITGAIQTEFDKRLRNMARIANNMMAKLPFDLESTMAAARTPMPTRESCNQRLKHLLHGCPLVRIYELIRR